MLQSLMNLWFPKTCVGCKKVLFQEENILCLHCLHNLDFVPFCTTSFAQMHHRFYGKLPLTYAIALLIYTKDSGKTKELIYHLKYKNRQEIGIFLADLFWCRWKNHPVFSQADVIVSIPLSNSKKKKRGYNQLDKFCERLSFLSNIPYNQTILKREGFSQSQTKKTIFQRSLTSDFKLATNRFSKYQSKHFLLVDDVVTTGSTMEKAGKLLLSIQDTRLSVLAFAYTR